MTPFTKTWLKPVAALVALLAIPCAVGAGTLKFNGQAAHAVMENSSASTDVLNLAGTTPCTIEAWVKTYALGNYQSIVTKFNAGIRGVYQFGLNADGTVHFHREAGPNFGFNSINTVTPGVWTHLAVTYAGGVRKIYINGQLDPAVDPGSGAVAGQAVNVLVGARYFLNALADSFNGELDEIRIWGAERTINEIQQNMFLHLTGTEPGLLVYYPAEDVAGTVTTDASGHGYHAVLAAGAIRNVTADALAPVALTAPASAIATNSALLTGQFLASDPVTNRLVWGTGSTALHFNGTPNEIIVPHDASLNAYPISLTTWVRVEPGGNGGLMNKYSASANGWRMFISNGRVRAVYFKDASNRLTGNTPGSSEVVTGPIDDGQWHHVTFTVDASGGKVYIDGRLGGSAPWVGTPGAATITAPVEIGWASGVFLSGQVDDPAIWSVALDTNAIAALIAAGQTTGHAQYSNVVAHWNLDAGQGTIVSDSSGHGHDGTISGSPRWQAGARPVLNQTTPPLAVSSSNSVLNLDGINDYVDVPDGVWFNGNFTVEFKAFVRRYNNYASFLDFGNGPDQNNVLISLSSGTGGLFQLWSYAGSSGSTLSSPMPVPLNEWVHLAVTLEGSQGSLFMNGVLWAQGTVNIPLNVMRTNNFLGRPNWAQDTYSDTLLNDVRIWNVARTPAQIRQGITEAADPGDPNLLLNYRFEETAGPIVVDSRSSAPQNGTLMNGSERLSLRSVTAPLAGLFPGTRYHYRATSQGTNLSAAGLISGFATLNPGRGTALDFDGKNDQVTGVVPQLPVGNSPYTIEAWIKPRTMGAKGIIGWGNYGVNNQVNALRLTADGLHNYWWNNDLTATVGDLTDGWHHVAASYDGTVRKIYVDGVVRAAANAIGHNVPHSANFAIGKTYSTEFFDGEMDEVRVWNIARTDDQVAQFMNERLAGDENGLVLYQRLDEGVETVTRDATVNATRLRLVGGVEWLGSSAGVAIPLATTLPAIAVGLGSATLKGAVNLEASGDASCWFEYGLGGNLNTSTPVQFFSSGVAIQDVSGTPTNFSGGQVYSFRLVAANANGTNFGALRTFYMPYPASGYALEFGGTNYVNMGDSVALKVSSALTLEAWIRPSGPGVGSGGIIINKEGEYEIARYPDGTLRWAVRNTSPGWVFVNTGVMAPLGQWMHVAFVYGGGRMRLYTNGVLASDLAATGNIGDIDATKNELWIGQRQAGGQAFQGAIDEVRVWGVSRSASEIAGNYDRLLTGNETGLLLYLRFDEGSGNTVYDLGPNHFVGTIVNNPQFIPSGAKPTGPLVTTLTPTPVLATSATLRGSVNPSGEGVVTYFEYGPTVAYGASVNSGSYPATLQNLPQSAALTGLEPGTTYHYRMVAYNTVRTNYGENQTFTTLVLGSGWPVSTKLTGGEASSPIHALDGLGNSYVAGIFSGSAAFRSPLSPSGGSSANAFVGKMSRTADWLWAINIPASSNGFTQIKGVALDASRNIYVTGQFSGTNTFVGATNLVSNGATNLFVAKLDSLGTNWLWARMVGSNASANAISVTGTNVLVAGGFSGTASFGVSNLVSAGGSDAFVAALDLNGDWLWANRGGGTNNAVANSLATDNSGNVYAAGQFAGNATFGNTQLTNAGQTDLFVAKLTPSGNWVLARRAGSQNNDATSVVLRDLDNEFYLVGQFGATADYDGAVNNLNVGSGSNMFVMRLNTEALFLDYTQGGSATPRAATVDSLGRVYVSGDFSFTASFGTNNLISSGNSDVFIAQMAGGDWTWAQKIGSAGTETGGSVTADADNTVVVSGTYQGTIQIGYVALTSPNNRDIFVTRFDANRVYEHNNYTVGQPIPVPIDAQDPAYGDGAIGYPTITILEKDQPDSDALNSFAWSIAEHKLFPVRQVTAIFKWPLTTNSASVVTAVGRVKYPTNPVVHIANAPVALEPDVPGFPLRFLNVSFTTIGGVTVDASTKQFNAPAPGWSVLQFLDTDGQTIDPTTQPSRFEVVRTLEWNDPQYLTNENATIGAALTRSSHADPEGKNGFVYFENSFYDGAGNERAYDRTTRTGPIIAVNKDTAAATDDLVVVWYHLSANGIGWPSEPVRYLASWPTNADELVLADRLGSGELSLMDFPNRRVYNQPDKTLPGFNPNEEHAALYGDTLYALRNDLNDVISPRASEPYTLLKYRDPSSGRWAMKVFKVVATNENFQFVYSGTAGSELDLPEPLSFLNLCNLSNRIVAGPGFQDYLGRIYARAAGPGNSGTNIVTRYWYPLHADFFYDLNLDGIADAPVGNCVPWLDRRPGGVAGTPVDITYNVTWPVDIPTLQIGETLLNAKFGLPDIRKFASANVIYDQGNPFSTNAVESLVRLFDPLSARTLQLATNFTLPGDIVTANDAGKLVFTDLPYHLRSRIRYDALNKQLSFSGVLNESVDYGGPGNPLLLINVLSPRERDRIVALSSESAFVQAINDLYDLTRNPNRLDVNRDGQPDKTLLIGLTYGYQTNGSAVVTNVVPEKLGAIPKALTAGPGTGTGFITLVENNDPSLGGLPVRLHLIRIADGPFRGDIKVLYPDNVFDEKLTLRHSGDFGGEPQRFEFQWYYMPDDPALNHTNLPSVDASGDIISLNDWTPYPSIPPGTNGFNDITIGDGAVGGLLTLADNWFLCRYRGYSINGETNWSDWVGVIGGGGPQLAEGWVKRVLFGLDPFNARTDAFHENETVTFASMLQQAGARYEGDIAFNPDGDNINNIGLISAYQTVLNRASKLSINATPGINYPPANNALLLAASRISDFYMLMGNEAYADAADPTIGFRTDAIGYGTLAPSIFTFQNQLDSLLEEELVLLRGRDDRSATVRSAPVYNRLFWNFTHGEGEVAYAQAYNIADQNNDGFINADDGRIMYPQGHGDAWGHYLTATKTYYSLLQSTNFDWIPRSESILLAGVPVEVDYLDERKFARAAAAKAKTGAELVDLTYRNAYVDDPAGQFQGYKDTDSSRAWGLSEWGHRAGSGAYFDWVTANAILPAVDPNTNHVGIQKIDRMTVTEIAEISANFDSVQDQIDKADRGLNPLGLTKNVVPFDIDPAQIDAGKTHFEQIYERAIEAMKNSVTVFNHANQLSQALRSLQDNINNFAQNTDQQERDYKNRLIEIFGYPYAGDIGAGRTYPSGYDGPDLYHYMYVNAVELNGETAPPASSFNAYFTSLSPAATNINHFFPNDLANFNDDPLSQNVLAVSYPMGAADYGFVPPASWGLRRAPGEIQLALSSLLQQEAALKRALKNYDALFGQIDDALALLEARYDLEAENLRVVNLRNKVNLAAKAVRLAGKITEEIGKDGSSTSRRMGAIAVEGFPKVVGLANDVTSVGRVGVLLAAEAAAKPFEIAEKVGNAAQQVADAAKEFVENRTAEQLRVATVNYELQQQVKALEQLFREEPGLRLEIYQLREAVNQSGGEYLAKVAEGLRLIEERIAFRKNAAAETQASRYQDMTFRIFRNDAIQKYRAQFDLAARYVFLTAVAYDYETQLLGGKPGAGRDFLTDIIRQRALGEVVNGVPVAGRHGLADPLARLSQNFGVLKGQLGFNNPQTETGRFSLRHELFRQQDTSDNEWRTELKKHIVADLWQIPEFRRYCRPFAPESAGPQPGIVIRFPTTVTFGLNYFGWPLGGGDSAYDSTLFATKVRSAGIWFENYPVSGLSQTPRVYLVPVGADVMRSPSGNDLQTREWRVVDQKIPVPFPIGFSSLNSPSWIPMNDSLSDTFADIRRFSSFRAYHYSGVFNPAETTTDSRLIGRSVWNTDWMLIIPGGTFLFDPNQGLDTFINSVGDIKIFFQTYAYSGD